MVLPILTVNIGAASRERAQRLLRWLARRPEAVFMLTETSAGAGTTYLLDQFRHAGYAVIKTQDDGDRGAALVSRVELATAPPIATFEKISIPGRVAAAVLATQPRIMVVAVYVPSRDRSAAKTERKERFIRSFLSGLAELPADLREHTAIGGDYNVISRTHRPRHPGFLPFEFALLETLEKHGFTDAFTECTPDVQAHSWIGRTGHGYQYDYFHLGSRLRPLIERCEYLHEPRHAGLTDHAAVTMTLRAPFPLLCTDAPAESREITLF